MEEVRAIVSGRVQGIGFRAKTKELAEALHLTGYVRNLTNGDVEICVQGDKEKLMLLLQQIQHIFKSYIKEVNALQRVPSILYKEFRVTLV